MATLFAEEYGSVMEKMVMVEQKPWLSLKGN
jgi:hypothetical protein